MSTYLLLGGILSIIALVAGGMFIASRTHYLVKVGMATLVVAMSIYAWSISVAAFGYAIDAYPHDKDRILAMEINKKEGFIYFWIAQKDGPRAYRIPYSDKTGKDLAEAEAQAKATGGIMLFSMGKKKQKDGSGQGGSGHGTGNDQANKGNGKDNGNGGHGGGAAHSYGGAPMGGDAAPVDVTIDVVPSLPEKS